MTILVLNSGSSSVKYRLFEMKGEKCLAWGIVERIGAKGSILNHQRHDGDKVKLAGEILDHKQAIEYILAILLSNNHGVLQDRSEIKAVGHRVVHGGEAFTGSVVIDPGVMDFHDCIELAPLHNPANIKGIQACTASMPGIPQVAVFDTAFHYQMPEYAFLYGLPYVLYKRYGVRRYGFHGTSHRYVSDRAAEMIGKPISDLKLVTCHLGNGCSAAAVDRGASVDTSMGFTPVEGLLMGTRTGDLDAAALLYVMRREDISVGDADSLINKHSGLLGISGVSNDMREIEESAKNGDRRADSALNVFCYRVRKYIGAYSAAMGGLDAVVFTGGIGENSSEVRKRTLQGLEFLGLDLDLDKNELASKEERFLDKGDSKRILVVPTNEELVIARDTLELVG